MQNSRMASFFLSTSHSFGKMSIGYNIQKTDLLQGKTSQWLKSLFKAPKEYAKA